MRWIIWLNDVMIISLSKSPVSAASSGSDWSAEGGSGCGDKAGFYK